MNNSNQPNKITLADIHETALITELCRDLPSQKEVMVGPGDDCAVVRPLNNSDWDWLLKSDPLIENVHFSPDAPPRAIGHKALARVFSDIAAMGGEPLWININLTAPPATPLEKIKDIYTGLKALAARYQAGITGGDVSSGTALALHVFCVGRVPQGQAILRSGAQPGDLICVTGKLGGSQTGRHLTFEPRLQIGQWLRQGAWANAMIDISDGLATDLRHLTQAGNVGAELEAAKIPIALPVLDAPAPLERALTDGEDFELLFTADPQRETELRQTWTQTFDTPLSIIGIIQPPENGVTIRHPDQTVSSLKQQGYEHFRIPLKQP